jgi:hypothetical protein
MNKVRWVGRVGRGEVGWRRAGGGGRGKGWLKIGAARGFRICFRKSRIIIIHESIAKGLGYKIS